MGSQEIWLMPTAFGGGANWILGSEKTGGAPGEGISDKFFQEALLLGR